MKCNCPLETVFIMLKKRMMDENKSISGQAFIGFTHHETGGARGGFPNSLVFKMVDIRW
jgi:hypothetical protein